MASAVNDSECYEVNGPHICSASIPESQVSLGFALQLAISKIFAIFLFFSICHNVEFQYFLFIYTLSVKIPKNKKKF